MTKLELNKRIAKALGRYRGAVGDWAPDSVKVSEVNDIFFIERNYASSWNDTMPLAIEHNIQHQKCYDNNGNEIYLIDAYVDDWDEATTTNSDLLRGYILCLIKVLEHKASENI